MGMFHSIQVGDQQITPIDWEMSPDLTFGTFESWGGRERVRNNSERIYYFFVDNWGDTPKLCLMERGVKHAKLVATIKAPRQMIENCVEKQGKVALFERSFAINEEIKDWLIGNVLDGGNSNLIIPEQQKQLVEDMGPLLPKAEAVVGEIERIDLPSGEAVINDDQIAEIIGRYNFFDKDHNPAGRFDNILVDNGDKLTVTDLKTGLMWQRGGLDISSIRTMQREIKELNQKGFAGYNDWRLPSMEETMSLLEQQKNDKGLYLHPCFTKLQAFIFVSAQRKPGGYWFVDFKQGRAFWSSGTIPGGFGRLCRKVG